VYINLKIATRIFPLRWYQYVKFWVWAHGLGGESEETGDMRPFYHHKSGDLSRLSGQHYMDLIPPMATKANAARKCVHCPVCKAWKKEGDALFLPDMHVSTRAVCSSLFPTVPHSCRQLTCALLACRLFVSDSRLVLFIFATALALRLALWRATAGAVVARRAAIKICPAANVSISKGLNITNTILHTQAHKRQQ